MHSTRSEFQHCFSERKNLGCKTRLVNNDNDNDNYNVVENERCMILWDMTIQCYHVIEARRPDIVVVEKESNKANLVPRSHSVTGNVRSGKVRQYTIFHWLLKQGCGNAIYAPIGLFRGALSECLIFASSCTVLNKCQLCGGEFCFFRRW